MPVLPDPDHAQGEHEQGRPDQGRGVVRAPTVGDGDHGGTDQSRDGVDLAAQHDRDDAGQDVAQHAAADAGEAAHRDGGDRPEARVQRLARAGGDEQPQPRGVEQPHRSRQPLDQRTEEEHGRRRDQRRQQVAAVLQRRGRDSQQQVPGHPTAERGDPRQEQHAEGVQTLLHGQRRPGQREDEDAEQVQRGQAHGPNSARSAAPCSSSSGAAGRSSGSG